MSIARALVRHLLSTGMKRRIADMICHERVGRGLAWSFGDRIPSHGLRIHTASPEIAPRTKAEIFWGIYESAEIRFVREHLRRDLDVLELGASIGVVSCQVALHAGARVRLACVEANPRLIETLEKNLRVSCPERAPIVINQAISYAAGCAEALLDRGDTSAATRVAESDDPVRPALRVPRSTLGELLKKLAFDRYALVCDIEGSEAGIVFQDGEALLGCQQIIAEFHDTTWQGQPVSASDLAEQLCCQHGFQMIACHGKVWALARD